MHTKVERWGGSLAVKIPDVLATGLGLEEETPVELSVDHGGLVMTPLAHHSLFLDQLLAGITDENLHEEISTGPAGSRAGRDRARPSTGSGSVCC